MVSVRIDFEVNTNTLSTYVYLTARINMKKSATQFAPESGTGMWKAEKNFFANGVSNQCQDKLSLEEQRQFIDRIHELLPTEDANWMMNGDSKE
ncbi:MAG: hypothetical protein ACI9CE_001046 [Flavobacterium sp.]|jgi:hypothetical protein